MIKYLLSLKIFFAATLAILLFGINSTFAQSLVTPVDNDATANTLVAGSAVGTTVGITGYTASTNVASGKTATASSTYSGFYAASYVTDGSTTGNFWASNGASTATIYVDLGADYSISSATIYWNNNYYASSYGIQVSTSTTFGTTNYSTTSGNGGTDNDAFTAVTGQYVRMNGTARPNTYYGLYEFQVYDNVTYSLTTNPSSYFAINASTGVVTANSASIPAGTYTIGITSTSGSVTSSAGSFTITVSVPAPTVTSSGSVCGSGSVTLNASDAAPTGGTYTFYSDAAGTNVLQTGTSNTYTTPTITSTTTYYVSYTSGGAKSSLTAVTATVNNAPILSSAPTTGGLTLSYPFTTNTATTTADVSGSSNTGILENSPTSSTDRFGIANSAYTFNGTNQYITSTNSTASPGPQNFSISLWFKTSSAGGLLADFGNLQTGSSTSKDRNIYMDNSGHIYFGLYNPGVKVLESPSTYADDTWHHVVVTESTTSGAFLYMDGVLVSSDATMTAAQSFAGYWRFGYDSINGWTNQPTNYYFTGSLDDVAVYTSAISVSQVYTLYGAGSPEVCLGSSLALQANTVSGATYSWSGPNGYTSSLQNPVVDASAKATEAGTYVLTVTSAAGCSYTQNVYATEYTTPAPAFTATSVVAVNGTATITLTSAVVAGDTYSWTFGTGASTATSTTTGPFSITYSTMGAQTVTLTETNANGCSTTVSQSIAVGGQAVTTGNYAFSQPITLNTSAISVGSPASGISSTLYNFPALVYIQENALIAVGNCANNVYFPTGSSTTNGYDFAFTMQGSTTELFYQVESYNALTGTLLVWVNVPTVTATNTALNFYFGSTAPGHTTAFTQATWANDYQAVYHFDEGSTTVPAVDATSHARNATQTNTALATGETHYAAGLASLGGYTFNGTSSKLKYAAGVNMSSTFTLSAWIKLNTLGKDQKVMTNQTSAGQDEYKLGVYTNNIPESETNGYVNRGVTPLAPAISNGTNEWHYVQSVFSGTTLSTYVDGVQYQTGSTTNTSSSNNPFYIGVGEGGNTLWFWGIISEARVSNAAKSTDWIKAEYYNQTNPTTFTSSNTPIVTNTLATAQTMGSSISYTWVGGSTNPALAANWNCTGSGATSVLPPTDGTASLIVNSSTNYPSYTAAPPTIYSLTMASGSQLYLGGYTLNVGCHIYNNGGTISSGTSSASTITSSTTGGILFNGSLATQYFYGSTSSGAANIANLQVANTYASGGTVDIKGGPVNLYNTLTMTKGNLLIDNANSGKLTLISNATGSASVGQVLTTCTSCVISGQAYVQRYITGGSGYRGYRFLSSPVNITDALTQTTQHNIDLNYLTAGMLTGGPTGTGGGFTMTTANPLIYLFDETRVVNHRAYSGGENVGVNSMKGASASPAYSITTLTPTLGVNAAAMVPVGNAYLVYFVGIAADGLNSTTPTSATVSAYGYLNQGTIPVYVTNGVTSSTAMTYTAITTTLASTPGLHQIGNPYASTIDLNMLYTDNIGNITPIFDELQEPNGAYVAYDASTGYTSATTAGRYIVSGQGFFVHAISNGATLTFYEHEKVNNQLVAGASSNPLLLNQKAKNINAMSANVFPLAANAGLHMQISKDSSTYTQTGIYFNSTGSDNYSPNEDAVDLDGTSVYLSSYSADNKRLSINELGDYSKGKVVKLYVSAASYGAYKLSLADINNIDSTTYNLYLRDHYLKDSINLYQTKTYNFNVLSDTASYGANRFDLVVELKNFPPYALINFTGQKITSGVALKWNVQNAGSYTGFILQKKNSDNTFTTIDSLQSNSSISNYSYTDKNPVIGNNIYRLAQNDIHGNVTYSSLVTIGYDGVSSSGYFSIYPNPAKDIINILVNSTTATVANYTADIYNTSGVIIDHRILNTYTWTEDVSKYKEGVYIIALKNINGDVLAKSKFIKTR